MRACRWPGLLVAALVASFASPGADRLPQAIRNPAGARDMIELDRAVPWTEVRELNHAERLWAALLPLDAGLSHWPEIRLGEAETLALLHGRAVAVSSPGSRSTGWVRLYEATGRFLGVGRLSGGGVLEPERILHGDRPRRRSLPA
mgnify:CR=1 FL=1